MERLASALEQAYGIRAEHVEPIRYGIWEECFAVRTAGGHLFAKRFHKKNRRREGMLRGLRLSERLRAQGFPAPAVLPARGGDLLADIEGATHQVTEWVPGLCHHPGDLPLEAAGPMGAVLGRFHRILGTAAIPPARPLPSPRQGAEDCRGMLGRFAGRTEPFAAVAREVLGEQIALLDALPGDFPDRLPLPGAGGPCFQAFWVEQVLFRADGQVAAVVDWTDGAGAPGRRVGDLDTAIHLSALDAAGLASFVAAYQAEHPLPEGEWRALAAALTYGHLAETGFFEAWLQGAYRRPADWEPIAARWHRQVPPRFRERAALEEAVLAAARPRTGL